MLMNKHQLIFAAGFVESRGQKSHVRSVLRFANIYTNSSSNLTINRTIVDIWDSDLVGECHDNSFIITLENHIDGRPASVSSLNNTVDRDNAYAEVNIA